MDYRQYIQSPEWKVRSRLYRNVHPRCEICGCDDKFELRCHHISYDHLGDEPDEDLMTLCDCCHQGIEYLKNYNTLGPNLHYYVMLGQFELLTYDKKYDGEKGFWYSPIIKKAMGVYAQFYDKIKEQHLKLYARFGEEFERFQYCEKRVSEFSNDVKDKAADESSLDVKLKKSEVDLLKYSGITKVDVDWLIAPNLAESFFDCLFDGLNGIDHRITYITDSCDDFYDYVSCARGENNPDDWIFFSAVNVVRYLLKIIDCYSTKYPNLAHNAKVLAYIMMSGLRGLYADLEEQKERESNETAQIQS